MDITGKKKFTDLSAQIARLSGQVETIRETYYPLALQVNAKVDEDRKVLYRLQPTVDALDAQVSQLREELGILLEEIASLRRALKEKGHQPGTEKS